MLTLAQIRGNLDELKKLLIVKKFDQTDLLKKAIQLDDRRKALQTEHDAILSESKNAAKEIGKLMGQGLKEEAEAAKQKTAELKERSKAMTAEQHHVAEQLREILLTVPNIPFHLVPEGNSEDDNELIREGGSKPELGESAKPHWELAKEYNLIDFELGVKISGAGFPVYIGAGAKLQRALASYFLDQGTAAGYLEYQPSLLVNEDSGYGTGQLPDKEGQMYKLADDNLYLIPTAEVPVTNILRDSIVPQDKLPLKMTAYTSCFRREAGSYGKHVRGLNRLHQFEKVEIVQVTTPDRSYEILDEMVAYVETLVQSLNLPYRIVRLCGGDLSFASAMTYDFEVWSAAQKRWLEISSESNFETFQANRLKLRYSDADNKKHLAHTLNGSALAFPRVLAALLENNQTEDGIDIPEVLQPYTGFTRIEKS